MSQNEKELIAEEQVKLNRLIAAMDSALADMERKQKQANTAFQKARQKGNPEAYGDLVSANRAYTNAKSGIKQFHQSRDSLYSQRMLLDYHNKAEQGQDELYIGLHDYVHKGHKFIISWLNNICRPFIMDPTKRSSECLVTDKYGEKYTTQYDLRLYREITLFWDKVEKVTERYSEYAPDEKAIYDSFLKTLLSRRGEQEFRNIVFSIQKRQGEIIQAPYDQNMIVQGCAGSGKTMIMFHRLPVILFDNPDALERTGIYVITPSEAYNQMVDNLRSDLEIQDLNMGTLEEYYLSVIKKYPGRELPYKTIDHSFNLTEEMESYVYSPKCIDDIHYFILKALNKTQEEYPSIIELIKKPAPAKTKQPPSQQLRGQTVQMQNLLDKANRNLRNYEIELKKFRKILIAMSNDLINLKTNVTNALQTTLEKTRKEYQTAKIIYSKQRYFEAEKKALEKSRKQIEDLRKDINHLQSLYSTVQIDDGYFMRLHDIADQLKKTSNLISNAASSDNNKGLYNVIDSQTTWIASFNQTISAFEQIHNRYPKESKDIFSYKRQAKKTLSNIVNTSQLCLSFDTFTKLQEAIKANTTVEYLFEQYVYWNIINIIDPEQSLFQKKAGLLCSPYLFLQVLFQCNGAPNAAKEKIIMIDEAQNLAIEEINLIQAVNNNTVTLNLFGDINQHIEHSKGIDTWTNLEDYSDYSKYYLPENYRNAQQITKYCNNELSTEMISINVDGAGVHEISTFDELHDTITHLFKKNHPSGNRCIIVKDARELDSLVSLFEQYESIINVVSASNDKLNPYKWNILTVAQSRGLEFTTVVVLANNMTRNEKYIAFTRALDELYVFEGEQPIITGASKTESEKQMPSKPVSKNRPTRQKRVIKPSDATEETVATEAAHPDHSTLPSLAQFFEQAGMEVIDDRKKSGFLWVIGSKAEIESIVKQAIKTYNILGIYGSGKSSGYKEGWGTLSKK